MSEGLRDMPTRSADDSRAVAESPPQAGGLSGLLAAMVAASALLGCSKAAPPAPPPPVAAKAVEVRPLSELTVRQERDAAATVASANESQIAAEVAGRLLAVRVVAGQGVARGELLAQIDAADYRLAVQRAEAALAQAAARVELAAAQLRRARGLVAQGFLSGEAAQARETEQQVAEADRLAAAAQLATAQNQLARTEIRAPFAGTVRTRQAQVGETVAPGAPLFVLVDRAGIEVVAQLQGTDVPLLGGAEQAAFVAGGRQWPLRLSRVSPVVDPQTRLVEARFAFVADPPPVGTAGRVTWRDTAASLPPAYLAQRNGDYGIFLPAHGRAHFHVLPGVQEGRPARIELPPGTPLIAGGLAALQPGDAIRIEAPPPGPAR